MIARQDGRTIEWHVILAFYPWPEDQPQDGAEHQTHDAVEHEAHFSRLTDVTLPAGAISNGLVVQDWAATFTAPLPVAQQLLVALRAAQIAAFAVAEADESAFRALSTRSPLDHTIYVDRARRSEAKTLIGQELRELNAQAGVEARPDVDQEFALLVEQLKTETFAEQTDDEEHFVPPSPGLSLSADPVTRAAWVGLIGGPVLLLLNVWGFLTLEGLAPLLGVSAFIAGFVTLVFRMPDRLPIDEGPDDGAVL